MADTDTSADRIAHNNSVFREANERIQGTAQAYGVGGLVPFLCECPDPRCTKIIQMPLDAYEAVRAVSTHFINGHPESHHEWAEVVETHEGYEIVEKVDRAANLADDLDPRAG